MTEANVSTAPAEPSAQAPAQEQRKGNGAAPAWDGTLKLHKAVPNGDGTQTMELKFREPTGADIVAAGGMPVMPNLAIDPLPMTEMMARLAAVPPSSIRAMDAKDWTTGAYKIFRFFTPDVFPSLT